MSTLLYIRIVVTTFFLLFINISSFAQPIVEWNKTYGGTNSETLENAVKTADGGFLLIGSSASSQGGDISENSFGNADFWIVRIDSTGRKIFDKRYGGSDNDICRAVVENSNGFLLVGESSSGATGNKTTQGKGSIDFWVIQINPNGIVLWDKTYGGSAEDRPYSVVEMVDNTYVIIGHSDSPVSGDKSNDTQGNRDIWAIKISATGTKIWDKTYGGNDDDELPTGAALTRDGNIIIACSSNSQISGDKSAPIKGEKDFWILKIAPDGTKIWDKTYGGDDEDTPRSVTELKDGSYIIAGSSASKNGADKSQNSFGSSDYWILKLDANGTKIWDKTFGGNGGDFAMTTDQNTEGYCLIGGISNSVVSGSKKDTLKGNFDFWLLSLNDKGDEIWQKSLGGSCNDIPIKMLKMSEDTYLVLGTSNSNKSFDKSENNRDNAGNCNNSPIANDDMWAVKIKCLSENNEKIDTIACKNQTLVLNVAKTNCSNCRYEWSAGPRTPAITITPTRDTLYKARISGGNGCIINKNFNIKVIPKPDTMFYTIKLPKCVGNADGKITLDSIRGGVPPYSLIVGVDTFRNRSVIDKLKAGTYPFTLQDRNGCKFETKAVIPNPPKLQLTIVPSLSIFAGDSFRLKASASSILDTFYWNENKIRSIDTILYPKSTQTFKITVVDKYGCQRDTQMTVIIDEKIALNYFAPTAFSPNNDFNNDVYMIFGDKRVETITNFKIFSRNGQLMYENPQIYPNVNQAGWDGKLDGKDVPPDTYIFMGQINYLNKRKEIIKGDFMLFR
jgi:gliding motility-associated-like protein